MGLQCRAIARGPFESVLPRIQLRSNVFALTLVLHSQAITLHARARNAPGTPEQSTGT
jgi:hypothetical protein